MKNHFTNIRAVLALGATFLVLPLTSAFNAAQADPPRRAPANGYRHRQETRRYTSRRPVYIPNYRRPGYRFDRNRYDRQDYRRNRNDRRDDWRRDNWRRDRR